MSLQTFLLNSLHVMRPDALLHGSGRSARVSNGFVDRNESSRAEHHAYRPSAAESRRGRSNHQHDGESQSSSEALRPDPAAHILCSGAMVLDSHEHAGSCPEPALDLQVPRIATPTSLNGNTLLAQEGLNA